MVSAPGIIGCWALNVECWMFLQFQPVPAMWPDPDHSGRRRRAGGPFLVAAQISPPAARRCRPDMEDLQRRQQQTTIDAKAQQQVLFNSMLEGLLLLDRNRPDLSRQPRVQKSVRHQDRAARQNHHGSAARARTRRSRRARGRRGPGVRLRTEAAGIERALAAGQRRRHLQLRRRTRRHDPGLPRSDAAQAARTHARGIRRQRQPRIAHAALAHQGLRGNAARRRAQQSRGRRALPQNHRAQRAAAGLAHPGFAHHLRAGIRTDEAEPAAGRIASAGGKSFCRSETAGRQQKHHAGQLSCPS